MVTALAADTGEVVMENIDEVLDPAETVTDAGTVTPGSLLLRSTVMPPLGAGPFSVILLFPLTVTPPTTEVGDSETAEIASGTIVNRALLLAPL